MTEKDCARDATGTPIRVGDRLFFPNSNQMGGSDWGEVTHVSDEPRLHPRSWRCGANYHLKIRRAGSGMVRPFYHPQECLILTDEQWRKLTGGAG